MTRKNNGRAAAADPKRVLADLQRTLGERLGPGPESTIAGLVAPDDVGGPECREFEAELRRLGYGEVELLDVPPCRHTHDKPYTLYVMPASACFAPTWVTGNGDAGRRRPVVGECAGQPRQPEVHHDAGMSVRDDRPRSWPHGAVSKRSRRAASSPVAVSRVRRPIARDEPKLRRSSERRSGPVRII